MAKSINIVVYKVEVAIVVVMEDSIVMEENVSKIRSVAFQQIVK